MLNEQQQLAVEISIVADSIRKAVIDDLISYEFREVRQSMIDIITDEFEGF